MKTRVCNWFDTKNLRELYSFQVYATGKWCHVHRGGKPLIFDTAEERDLARREFKAKHSRATP